MINRLPAVLAWTLLAALTVATLGPISLRPKTGHVVLERFLAFLMLGAAFGVGYPRRMPFAAAVTIFAAAGLEAAQLLVSGRHARLIDASEKLAGGVAGLALAAIYLALLARRQTPNPA